MILRAKPAEDAAKVAEALTCDVQKAAASGRTVMVVGLLLNSNSEPPFDTAQVVFFTKLLFSSTTLTWTCWLVPEMMVAHPVIMRTVAAKKVVFTCRISALWIKDSHIVHGFDV